MEFIKDPKNTKKVRIGIFCVLFIVLIISAFLYRQFEASRSKITSAIGEAPLVVRPSVITQPATSVTASEATINGIVASTGGAPTDAGFVYENEPVDSMNMTSPGGYSVHLTDLTCATTYSFNATASNSVGKIDGGTRVFTTLACASAGTPSGKTK